MRSAQLFARRQVDLEPKEAAVRVCQRPHEGHERDQADHEHDGQQSVLKRLSDGELHSLAAISPNPFGKILWGLPPSRSQ
jgi:hypothetical protein